MTRAIIKAALNIDELSYNLDNICTDDKCNIEDLSDEEIVAEAVYVLSLFFEAGHINNIALVEETDSYYDRKWALSEIRKLRAFLKKYRKAPTRWDNCLFLPARDKFVQAA